MMAGNGQYEPGRARDFFRIGEVSRLTDTKPFVLRYWETEFPSLQPVKSAKGHRLYRREDVETVLVIKRLLYDEGFTIAGARRHLRDGAAAAILPENTAANDAVAGDPPAQELAGGSAARAASRPVEPPANVSRKVLLDLRDALRTFLTVLESE